MVANGQSCAKSQQDDVCEQKVTSKVEAAEVHEPSEWHAMVTKLRLRAVDCLSQACTDGSLQDALEQVLGEPEAIDEASTFISGLLMEAVDDYSDEMVYEIRHKYEAAQVFDVPEPPIPEEDETAFEEDEANELYAPVIYGAEDAGDAQDIKVAFGEAAMEITLLALEKANMDFVGGMDEDSFYDVYDNEDVVSVISEVDYMDDADAVAAEVAQELVLTVPDQVDKQMAQQLEHIRSLMKDTLQLACDNGQLEGMLQHVVEERREGSRVREPEESWWLPSTSILPRCTRPSFSRRLQPQPEGAPVMEEPFPFDCLPPTPAVAKASAPSSEAALQRSALKAREGAAREIASANLQHLYAQASKALALAQPDQKTAPVAEPAAVQKTIAQARAAFQTAANDGKLERLLQEIVDKKKQDEFKAAQHKMRHTLVDAMEDGRLDDALTQFKFERMCSQAREVLLDAATSGRLEAAMREVAMPKETPEAAPACVPTLAPSPPKEPQSPARRRFSGARATAVSSEASAQPQPVAPVAPRAPTTPSCGSPRKARLSITSSPASPTPAPPATRPAGRPGARPTSMLALATADCQPETPTPTSATPVPPAGARPGVRRPGRSSTSGMIALGPAEEAPGEQATTTTPCAASVGPPGPLRHSSRRHTEGPRQQACLSARGSGPTALELDHGLAAGSISAAAAPGGSMTPRGAAEMLRLSKHVAFGTGLLPTLPSKAAGSLAWSMGLEHSAVQHKMDLAAKVRSSANF